MFRALLCALAVLGFAQAPARDTDEAVTIVLQRGARVTGRVVAERGALPSNAVVEINASLIELEIIAPPGLSAAQRVRPDGTFKLTDLVGPLRLRARVFGARGRVPKAIVHNGRDLIDAPIALNSGETLAGVDVILTDKVAALTGTVIDAGRRRPITRSCCFLKTGRS